MECKSCVALCVGYAEWCAQPTSVLSCLDEFSVGGTRQLELEGRHKANSGYGSILLAQLVAEAMEGDGSVWMFQKEEGAAL
jgi:hypothetical protein